MLNWSDGYAGHGVVPVEDVMREAADRIERLVDEIETLEGKIMGGVRPQTEC